MAKCSILAIQMRSILVHDEELAAGRVGVHSAGHADHAAGVLDGVVHAVLQELALDVPAGAAHAGALRVAALNHKAGDNAVEGQAVVEALLDELLKVLAGDGCCGSIQFNVNGFAVLHRNTNHRC